jgi:hypothetical protein
MEQIQMKQIRMNGIRLSPPQVGVSQICRISTADSSYYLYRYMAAERVNMTFLNLFCTDDSIRINCCIPPEKKAGVEALALRDDTGVTCRPRVGTVSVYPHGFRFSVLGYLLHLFGEKGFHFYQMATSGAMLTFVVDYVHQEEMAAGLEQELELPVTRTPFRQDINADELLALLRKQPETSAKYVETKIRTYGIGTKAGLALCSATIPVTALAEWGDRIRMLEDHGLRFAFASAETLPDGCIRLCFLSEAEAIDSEELTAFTEDNGYESVIRSVLDGAEENITVVTDVCLISLQGPHFGDRYGIAEHAFTALMNGSVPILAAACVGAMIYMVVPEAGKHRSTSLLSEVFETP